MNERVIDSQPSFWRAFVSRAPGWVALFVLATLVVVAIAANRMLDWIQAHGAEWAAKNWVFLVLLGVIAGLFIFAKPIWQVVHTTLMFREDMLDRREQRKLITQSSVSAERGMNVKYNNARAGIQVEIANPYIPAMIPRGRAAQVTEVEDRSNQLPSPQVPTNFVETLRSFRPSVEQIFLSYRPEGEMILVPLKSLCHVGLVGATGNGKTTMLRMIMPQIQYVGGMTFMADPHFTPYDLESGEDWRPIADRLAVNPITQTNEPLTQYKDIKAFLRWLAEVEMVRRLELRRRVQPWGSPIFAAFPEWPAIADAVPEAAGYLGEILRQGRKVGVNVIVDTQDLLAQTFAPSKKRSNDDDSPSNPAGAVRKCFRTGAYVGGDQTSAKIILDVKGAVEDNKLRLGKGKLMIRCASLPEATLAYAPYPSNESIYQLLPYSETQLAYPPVPALSAKASSAYNIQTTFNDDEDDFQDELAYSAPTEELAFESVRTPITGNLENDVKAPEKSDESIPSFSEEDERQILEIGRIHLATYGRVIRSKIPASMNPPRNNAIYPVVKYICDREGWKDARSQ